MEESEHNLRIEKIAEKILSDKKSQKALLKYAQKKHRN